MLNDTDTHNIVADIENVEATLSATLERAAELMSKLRMAKGTSDHTEVAKALTAPKPETIASKVEAALRGQVMTLGELAKAIDEPESRTANAIRNLRKNLGNIGTPAMARWTWRVGDDSTPEELRSSILALLSDQPLTTAELVNATGARAARVSGELVNIQRSGAHVLNLNTGKRHRWFVVAPTAQDATLRPNRAKS